MDLKRRIEKVERRRPAARRYVYRDADGVLHDVATGEVVVATGRVVVVKRLGNASWNDL